MPLQPQHTEELPTSLLSPSIWQSIDDVVALIHSGDIGTLLPHTIEALRGVVSFSHSMYHHVHLSRETNIPESYGYGSPDLDPPVLQAYLDDFEKTDYINWYANEPITRAFRDTDIITELSRAQTPVMTGWMEPNHLHYSAGVTIACKGNAYGALYLFRSREEGDFSDADVEVLQVLGRHLGIRYFREYPNGRVPRESTNEVDLFAAHFKLTVKEKEIVQHMIQGCSRNGLAERLYIADNTLKKHLSHLYRKTGTEHYDELLRLVLSC